MPSLKLGAIADDRPIRLTVQLPANVHRMLLAYAELHGKETGQVLALEKLIPAILERFMATDRVFSRERKRAERRVESGSTP
jgi:hypothetical protein